MAYESVIGVLLELSIIEGLVYNGRPSGQLLVGLGGMPSLMYSLPMSQYSRATTLYGSFYS
jgi:hypothetical protein